MRPNAMRFLKATIRFLASVGLALFCIMYLLDRYFPPDAQTMMTAAGATANGAGPDQDEPSLMEKLRDAWRWRERERDRNVGEGVETYVRESDRREGGRQGGGRRDPGDADGDPNGGGMPGRRMGRTQLVVRETSLAEFFLQSMHGRDLDSSRYSLNQLPVRTNAEVAFERMRFEYRVLEDHYYQREAHLASDPELRVLESLMTQISASPYSSFEDHADMGELYLMMGQPDKAKVWLEKAAMTWPSGSHSYGVLHLLLMFTYAAQGDTARTLPMVDSFTSANSDWLYPERFMGDMVTLEDIERTYPDAPLVPLVRGRLWYNVRNHAGAEREWRRARAMPDLDSSAAQRLDLWLAELQADREGSSR